MLSLTDQAGNTITLHQLPERIISLVPSQTELLFDLGLDEEVTGITKFCIHPNEWFKNKTRVGGTKTVNIQKVADLKPDLIIANKEENVKEQIEELQKIAPVYVSDISNLEDALQMIKDVGQLVGKDEKAKYLVLEIETGFDELGTINAQYSTLHAQADAVNLSTNQHTQLKTAFLIWKDPYMAAGGDTFINDMMKRCGFKNIFENINRYPAITINQHPSTVIPNLSSVNCQLSSPDSYRVNCQLLLLSSEPYPFKQKHIAELQQHLPDTKIVLADGEMFSWYGSRLLQAPEYFKKLIALVQP